MLAARLPAPPSPSARRRPLHTNRWPLAAAALALLMSSLVSPPAQASSPYVHPNDPGVITSWNKLATDALLADTTKRPQESFLYGAFVDVAVYDAVVGIHRDYEPFLYAPKPKRPASAQAAALAAAWTIVRTYVPSAQSTADAAYAEGLARLRPGAATTNGLAYGVRVADHLVADRADDGRNAATPPLPPPAPGVWRPTPPAMLPFFVPWMGGVRPLALTSGDQFDPGLPPALESSTYANEYAEVKAMGAKTGSSRTPEQTATAIFFSGNATAQFNAARRDQVAQRQLGLVDAARLFAAVGVSEADAIIAVWNAKAKYLFWRPITAINLGDTDNNPATTPDPSWEPLLVTPPYPDYVSGYSGVVGSFTRSLSRAIGGDPINANLPSTAVPGVIRSYTTAAELNQAVVDARVWLGIHFRTADVKAAQIGGDVADWVLDHHFQPTGDDG
jgi:hypothetical protein